MSKRKRHGAKVEKLAERRAPGLDGTYSGTCVGCLRATDTALAVKGDPEWHAAFLVNIGLPMKEASALVLSQHDDPEYGPGIRLYRVCGKCTAKVPSLPEPALVMEGNPVPVIGQRGV